MTLKEIITTVCMIVFFYITLYLHGYYDYMTKKGIEAAKKRKEALRRWRNSVNHLD